MNPEAKKILEQYKQVISSKVNAENIIVDEEGRIEIGGTRWILMDIKAFPAYMIKVTKQIVGKMAPQFIYWFGYAYGEDVADRYLSLGMPPEDVVTFIFAFTAAVTGWGIAKVEEFSIEKKYIRIKVWNDFETESNRINNENDTVGFLRGVAAGLFSKILNEKMETAYKIEGDSFIMEIIPRQKKVTF